MTAKFQLVIDCADPEPLAGFWVAALGYEFATLVRVIREDGVDHYGIAMLDPEGNEFDIN